MKKFQYYFIVSEKDKEEAYPVEVKYHIASDGLSDAVRFPQIGEHVVLKGKIFICKGVTHNYDDAVVGFHLFETSIE